MILIKVGGSIDCNQRGIAQEIAALTEPVILVHGASQRRDTLAKQLGKPTQRIVSPSGVTSVLTDRNAIEIMLMAYAGLVNKQWVEILHQAGANAVGLTGADGGIWRGPRKKHLFRMVNGKKMLIQDTFTGRVTMINTQLLQLLLDHGYLPVLTQPALSEENQLMNTDNDLAVAALVAALPIRTLVFLFAAPGLLRDPNDPTSLIKQIERADLPQMLSYARGTMKKKVIAASEAFIQGVERIYWGDARIDQPLTRALAGEGTIII